MVLKKIGETVTTIQDGNGNIYLTNSQSSDTTYQVTTSYTVNSQTDGYTSSGTHSGGDGIVYGDTLNIASSTLWDGVDQVDTYHRVDIEVTNWQYDTNTGMEFVDGTGEIVARIDNLSGNSTWFDTVNNRSGILTDLTFYDDVNYGSYSYSVSVTNYADVVDTSASVSKI